MITFKITTTKSGNCPCMNCGEIQPGMKYHPYSVWYKEDNEKRGHNLPVCSKSCGNNLIDHFKSKNAEDASYINFILA